MALPSSKIREIVFQFLFCHDFYESEEKELLKRQRKLVKKDKRDKKKLKRFEEKRKRNKEELKWIKETLRDRKWESA